ALVNRAIPFPDQIKGNLEPLIEISNSDEDFDKKVERLEVALGEFIHDVDQKSHDFQRAVELIISTKGSQRLSEIWKQAHVSERSLERYFKKYIGLSPKLYSRIIRFSNIFHFIQSKNFEWTEISFLSGFYDQSHFIKNFKEFTGEDPSEYGFDQENMANLFLKPG
ncbi:MAG: AraC family transcriptional regulator, partial [Saprospiraceae bacterium]|nr:AraC family transcriptional regulator [Saprospiraceae bacterium]